MILSNEELEFALGCAKSYYYESSESDYPNKSDKDNEIRFRDLENSLYADNLEIEGYERLRWTKFDKNDPSTYPPTGQHFIAYGHGHMNVMFRYTSVTESNEEFANRYFERYGFTHWRPAPKAPVETEETK